MSRRQHGNKCADNAVFTFISALTAVNAFDTGRAADFEKHRNNFESVARAVAVFGECRQIGAGQTDCDAQRKDVRDRVRGHCHMVIRSCATGGYNASTNLFPISQFVQTHAAKIVRDGTHSTKRIHQVVSKCAD